MQTNAAIPEGADPSADVYRFRTVLPDGTPRTTVVSVPVRPARGPGGQAHPRLYEATIHGEPHVMWELADGRVACTPAWCPHRPDAGPVLLLRGAIDGENILCTRHGNLYSGTTGGCVRVEGDGAAGELLLHFGRRFGDEFVIDLFTAEE